VRRRALLLAVAAPTAARAQEARPQVLREGQQLRGRFTQERRLQGFARPLRSEGDFLLLPGRGLIWRGTAPFASTLVITQGGILQLLDGREAMRLPASRAPGLGQFYQVLAGAMSGDPANLGQVFNVGWQADASQWQLTLTPRRADDPALASIASITVRGERLVDAVEVRKANGDADLMAFHDQQVGPAAPDAAEQALLSQLAP
jgi:hypothetical protein